MDKFVVRGGNPLLGTIKVSGAKNSALPCMAAAILTEDEVILENIPQVRDIETERKLLTSMGAEVELGYGRAQHRTRIKCGILSDPVAKYEIVKTMRASSLVLGPLIARTGIARVAMPGGCAIGGRPIDLHILGLEAMGATITQDHGYLEARSPNDGKGRLKGAHIVFDKITVTGTGTIRIQGVAKLHGARHRINPDRIEAGTFLIAGAITGGDLNVDCCEPKHLGALISKLEQCGVKIDVGADKVRIRSGGANGGELKAADITTEEYPGFPTDMQAQYMALATQAEGTSTVTENIFENRFMHVQELIRMGANITISGRTATVRGKSPLQSAAVMCSDLRASASLVLAALVADGETILDRVYHLDRGYEHFEEKLRGVGAQIRRMGDVFGKK